MSPTLPNTHPLKPSLVERPIYRVRFTCPDGHPQQATVSSTWNTSPMLRRHDVSDEQIEHNRRHLTTSLESYYASVGCRVLCLELISTTSVVDMVDFPA